jgi:perosamine synthetase
VKFARAEGSNRANHWLNAIILESSEDRNRFLVATNEKGVMVRPIWQLMSELPMFKNCQTDGLVNFKWLVDRVVNIPSSVPEGCLSDLVED